MALQDTDEPFSLEIALRPLVTARQTGRLSVHGDDGRVGNVWLSDGSIVAAVSVNVTGGPTEEALADLLGRQCSTFAFRPGDDGPDTAADHPLPTAVTLSRAADLRREWDDLRRRCPTPAHRVVLLGDPRSAQTAVGPDVWPVVAALATPRTAGELAEMFDLRELEVLRVIGGLADLGLVRVEAPLSTGATSIGKVAGTHGR